MTLVKKKLMLHCFTRYQWDKDAEAFRHDRYETAVQTCPRTDQFHYEI